MKTAFYTKKYVFLFAPFFMAIILSITSSCKKENTTTIFDTRSIQIVNEGVSEISDDKIILNGIIENLNSETIIDHGFIIKEENQQTAGTTISLGNTPKIGPFQYTYIPHTKPELGNSFSYHFYLKTDKSYYKSGEYYFKVDGIKIIQSGTFAQATGDTVHIKGEFSKVDSKYSIDILDLNARQIPIVLNKEKTQLSFVMPATLGTHNKIVKATLNRYESTKFYSRPLINLRTLGRITAPTKLNYFLYEPVAFGGVNSYEVNNYDGSLRLIIGELQIPFSPNVNLSTLSNLKGSSFRIGYLNGRDSVIFPQQIAINRPTADLFQLTAKEAHPNTLIKLRFDDYTKYYYNLERPTLIFTDRGNSYTIPNSPHDYSEYYLGEIPEATYNVNLKHAIGSVQSSQQVNIKKLHWTLPTQSDYYPGDNITISGNFIDGNHYTLKLENSDYIYELPVVKDKLQFQIPSIAHGNTSWKIGYKQYDGSTYFTSDALKFNVLSPAFDSFSPSKGTVGEVIVMKGRAIKYAQHFFLGDIPIIPIISNNDEIMFQIPLSMSKGKIRLSIVTNGKTISPGYLEIY
ncbi:MULTISPECIES: IPT/TIG domain-containing protein [Sphingobacterium]|uniref:IPT/TIG domain-containing protein n=1 Tax=Sphingobacterium TaxID=28453 RepID=UPI00104D70A2|nr:MULTISPECIES: IPT/TIG domain-containing protein [Sphingobacterium]MCW2260064.1 hypothetical protein [Sphingobacterium kitahiroshimense]NJI72009.1 hypothetical protein [Sphingobacterium sp. B16(2022)]TCR11144.1 hypothetical protein EDF67_104237 [Sphingobacterium sp. JUb78]